MPSLLPRLPSLAAALAVAGLAAAVRAQACVALPSDTPAIGAPSSVPFGNNNPSDPIFSDTRYQVLVPRTLLGTQPLVIRDLQVAPAGSRLRRFVELTVTLGHNPTGQLVNPMSQNLGAPTQGTTTQQWLLPTTANEWSPLGLPMAFPYDPALGDLVIEFRVRGAGALGGSGTAGLRTDQALPYMWTTGGGTSGNGFAGGGIKLRLCTDTHGLLALGGGCPGANGAVPQLSYGGSAQVGGPGLQVQLGGGWLLPGAPAVLVWSFGLRPAPLDLGPLGAAGCSVHVFGDVTMAASLANGSASVPFAVPAAPFPCVPLWNQWVLLDPAANALGLATSNPGRILVGN